MIPKILSISFTQEADSCSESGEQIIFIETRDAGAGDYYYFKTEGWAFDNIQELIDLLNQVKELMGIEPDVYDDLPKSNIIHPTLKGITDPFGNTLPDSVSSPSTLPNNFSITKGTAGTTPLTPLGVQFQTDGDSDWETLSVEKTTREPSDIKLKEEEVAIDVASKNLLHGAKVMIDYIGNKDEGKISISPEGEYYLCSNMPILNGKIYDDKLGYKYSWVVPDIEFDEEGVYTFGCMTLQLCE